MNKIGIKFSIKVKINHINHTHLKVISEYYLFFPKDPK